ncbi:MAG TPA: hypothetical protein VKA84_23210 [Gemmatimonadaceae bacterium]|nr:hypothetical protein [Gemmatimonadaceae bacterium]
MRETAPEVARIRDGTAAAPTPEQLPRRRASSPTFAAFDALAKQLAAAPDSPEVVEALRRELHRVHEGFARKL